MNRIWFAMLLATSLGIHAKATVRANGEAHSDGPAIKRSEHLSVEGAKLYLLIRGADRGAPVLLWLHGGPGGAERPLFRYFNSELEEDFVVVYWDQRGTGRSFDREADPRRLTIAQHITDLDAVVDHLRRSLGQDKINLVGHSWGSALGMLYAQKHPHKVSAFIGVNQVVSTRESQRAEYNFVRTEATRQGDGQVLARLQEIGVPPYREVQQVLGIERLVQRYGGVFHSEPSRTWILVRGILCGLVSPWEIPRFIRANNVSLEAMKEELLGLDLTRLVRRVEVPVFFFLGRHDRHVDSNLAAAYFEMLQAPVKRLVWFEESAHNVPFEEPDRFNGETVRALRNLDRHLKQ